MTELTNDKIDEILIPMLFGEEGMAKQDGSSLMGQIVYSQNSKLSKSREKIKSLIHQAEIKARIDELSAIYTRKDNKSGKSWSFLTKTMKEQSK